MIRRLAAALALGLALPASATVLHVAEVSGGAAIQREDAAIVPAPGYQLVDGDVLTLEAGGRLDLQLGRHGWLELGPGAQLVVEHVPFASYAADLRTRLRLVQGYARILWKRPAGAASWPLSFAVGDFTLVLSAGEFLLQADGAAPVLCLGDGQAVIDHRPAGGAAQSKSIAGPACATLLASAEVFLPTLAVQADDLFGPRQNRALTLAAATTPAAIAPSPPPAREAATGARPASGPWVVTLASFPERALAEAQAARLRLAGYTVEVVEAAVKRAPWFRVQLRGFPTFDLARQTATELKERAGYKDAWVSRQ